MKELPTLNSEWGQQTKIYHEPTNNWSALARDGKVDAVIVSTEDANPSVVGSIATDLGVPEKEILQLDHRNRHKNRHVTLIAIPSRRPNESLLRGIILAPCEKSRCYSSFEVSRIGSPYRDFFYNVAFESIAYACKEWKARYLALLHLAEQRFHPNMATCNAEALGHFCDEAVLQPPASFAFVGQRISLDQLSEIMRLNTERNQTRHRAIPFEREEKAGNDFIHLDLPKQIHFRSDAPWPTPTVPAKGLSRPKTAAVATESRRIPAAPGEPAKGNSRKKPSRKTPLKSAKSGKVKTVKMRRRRKQP